MQRRVSFYNGDNLELFIYLGFPFFFFFFFFFLVSPMLHLEVWGMIKTHEKKRKSELECVFIYNILII
jgi:hypothetical protein